MSESKKEFNEIPIVKLTNYSFSPPGPMGWSSAEYTAMLEDPEAFLSSYKIKHPEPQLENVTLIELPVKNRRHLEMNQSVKNVVKREIAAEEKKPVAEEKKPLLEAAPIMRAELEPAPIEAVQDDHFEDNYDKSMDHFLDSDADIHETDVFIGGRKRKSETYSSKRSNRVIFY
ncbi:hypothetical protein [Metabacillus idriensis]|uniref:hypothetical protein n=1 Tax=Metabacillus idriensis TaxID=324768 RepID=UPI0017490755|nr:hypothetical protein [Metabacillus idriensis]